MHKEAIDSTKKGANNCPIVLKFLTFNILPTIEQQEIIGTRIIFQKKSTGVFKVYYVTYNE